MLKSLKLLKVLQLLVMLLYLMQNLDPNIDIQSSSMLLHWDHNNLLHPNHKRHCYFHHRKNCLLSTMEILLVFKQWYSFIWKELRILSPSSGNGTYHMILAGFGLWLIQRKKYSTKQQVLWTCWYWMCLERESVELLYSVKTIDTSAIN